MGYVMGMGSCLGCGKVFTFNPMKVPTIRDPKSGEKEPICGICMHKANVRREEMGLPPHHIEPDAYEPANEEELS